MSSAAHEDFGGHRQVNYIAASEPHPVDVKAAFCQEDFQAFGKSTQRWIRMGGRKRHGLPLLRSKPPVAQQRLLAPVPRFMTFERNASEEKATWLVDWSNVSKATALGWSDANADNAFIVSWSITWALVQYPSWVLPMWSVSVTRP
jgi:hypothetical protein